MFVAYFSVRSKAQVCPCGTPDQLTFPRCLVSSLALAIGLGCVTSLGYYNFTRCTMVDKVAVQSSSKGVVSVG